MTAPTLTAQAYDAIRMFAEGQSPPAIAETLGIRWMEVRDLLNVHVHGHQGKAKRLVETTPRPEGASPLTAPIVRAKPVKEVPARLKEEPVPTGMVGMALHREAAASVRLDGETVVIPGPVTVGPSLPKPNVDDLQSLHDVVRAAQGTPHQATANEAADAISAVREAIIADRTKAAAAARIVDLEAELVALRELVAA